MTTTADTTSTIHSNFRLAVVRTLAVGLLAGGAAVAVAGPLAGSASAGPIIPPFPGNGFPTITIPPQTTTTTIKVKFPPYGTIPPVIVLDPGTPPTTVTPTTVPPTTAVPTTVAPTTAAPKPPTAEKPTTKKPGNIGVQVESATQGGPAPIADPVADPLVEPVATVVPTEEQALASGSDPITLGKDDSLPVLPIAGGALAAAAALVIGGLAYDKRRKV